MSSCASEDRVFIPGIFKLENFHWGEEIFRFTIELINNHTDGFFDEVFNDGTTIDFDVVDGGCDRNVAMRQYWRLRNEQNHGCAPHGIIGCRCSGASMAVASIASLEHVPQMSFASKSSDLSDTTNYPYFFRVVDAQEAAALKALYRELGWKRITILQTEKAWAQKLVTSFHELWSSPEDDGFEGEIINLPTVVVNEDDTVDEASVRQALKGIPAGDNRIILIAAHHHHVLPILKMAQQVPNMPHDLVWTGLSPKDWFTNTDDDDSLKAIANSSSFLGIEPFSNVKGAVYQDYLARLQAWQASHGLKVLDDLPDYKYFYEVDAILSLSMALSNTPKHQRRNGTAVTQSLHNLHNFIGLTGDLEFTQQGDRKDLQYSIYHNQKGGSGSSASFVWDNVGVISPTNGTHLKKTALCFQDFQCGVIPLDHYIRDSGGPDNVAPLVLLAFFGVAAVAFGFLYKHDHSGKTKYKKIIQAIDAELDDLDKQVGTQEKRRAHLIIERARLKDGKPKGWSGTGEKLVEVSPEQPEYWNVQERLQRTMSDAHISKLWRVENVPLWSYYSFHKDRILKQMYTGDIPADDIPEVLAWHGTRYLDPAVIYEDEHDGFMTNHAAVGLWGRGIYFAQNASYSHNYAHIPYRAQPSPSNQRRGTATDEEREMFLCKLCTGTEVCLEQDSSLTAPPANPQTNYKFRYHTVTGTTGDSRVWVVYQNGRAYPQYLVRYYRGERDPDRSPYSMRPPAAAMLKDPADIECGQTEASEGTSDQRLEIDINCGQTDQYSSLEIDTASA